MNEFLAFSMEPGWASLAAGGLVFVTAVIFKFAGDARWERKDAASEKVALAKDAMDREVRALQAADAEVKKAIEELTATVTAQDKTRESQVTELKSEMNRGFRDITEMFNKGMLLLTKEVSILQGRLAGASGIAQKSE